MKSSISLYRFRFRRAMSSRAGVGGQLRRRGGQAEARLALSPAQGVRVGAGGRHGGGGGGGACRGGGEGVGRVARR